MKVTEATGRGTKALYYDISTDSGTLLGSACVNFYPLGDDDEVTIEDARKNAILWAAAPDLLEALETACNFIEVFYAKHKGYLGKDWEDAMSAGVKEMKSAINKARGL